MKLAPFYVSLQQALCGYTSVSEEVDDRETALGFRGDEGTEMLLGLTLHLCWGRMVKAQAGSSLCAAFNS